MYADNILILDVECRCREPSKSEAPRTAEECYVLTAEPRVYIAVTLMPDPTAIQQQDIVARSDPLRA